MPSTTRQMTADELLNMPDDGFRHELLRGELRTMPLRGFAEGVVAAQVAGSLGGHVRSNKLGSALIATGFVLESDPDTVLAPAVSFVQRKLEKPLGDSDSYIYGPPDVAVEIVSFTDRTTNMDEKVADWLRAGTPAVILVDPRRQVVEVHRSSTDVVVLGEEDTLEVGDIVPGWQDAGWGDFRVVRRGCCASSGDDCRQSERSVTRQGSDTGALFR